MPSRCKTNRIITAPGEGDQNGSYNNHWMVTRIYSNQSDTANEIDASF